MKLLLTNEHRFYSTPDGAVWTQTMFPYKFWSQYLSIFDQVLILARIMSCGAAQQDWIRADGDGVAFYGVPYYVGPWQYLQKARGVRRSASNALGFCDAVIMRVPSILANALEPLLNRLARPFGLEVVGDPYDVCAPGAIRHPLRPLFRVMFTWQLRRQCLRASALHYVTQLSLQRRYPPSKNAFTINYSDVDLTPGSFASAPRQFEVGQQSYNIITIGTLSQLYKATDILLASVARCIDRGLDLRLVIVGDGTYRSELESLAASLGLGERVQFLGQLPAGDAVRARLDQADLFVLPSRAEGLPRAMIEAMARALPCIGSTAGGIPELLAPEDLVPPGDIERLSIKLIEVLKAPDRMTRMSIRNLTKSHAYHEDTSRAKREQFYEYIRTRTQMWLVRNCS